MRELGCRRCPLFVDNVFEWGFDVIGQLSPSWLFLWAINFDDKTDDT